MVTLESQPVRVRDAVQEFARRVVTRFADDVVELRLFESQARGQAHTESDVDVSVVLEQVSWKDRCQVLDLAADVGLEYDLLISPVVFDRQTFERWKHQERPLVLDVEREGIPL